MNLLSWGCLVGAGVAGAAAVQAGDNVNIAVPAGAVAVLLVAIVGASRLRSTTVQLVPARAGVVHEAPPRREESDSLLRLRRAFRGGEIGRSSILATVRALERELVPGSRPPLTLDSERALLQLPSDEFRQWVDDRLGPIEAAT